MDLSWLDVWWLGQLLLVASCFILDALHAKDLSPPDSPIRFYQFHKKIHFYYMFGLLWTGWLAYTAGRTYLFGDEASEHLVWMLYSLVPVKRSLTTDAGSVMLALLLLMLHLGRRLYESVAISISSHRHYLNIIDVLLSYSFYAAAGLTVLADGPDLLLQQVGLQQLGIRHLLAVVLYTWAAIHQQRANKVFAKLRRNRFGHIVTTEYGKPTGDWFDMVSSPHYLAEVLIYSSIGLVLGANATSWWFLCAYLITQQLITAHNKHRWYHNRYPDYPPTRKALIPFLL